MNVIFSSNNDPVIARQSVRSSVKNDRLLLIEASIPSTLKSFYGILLK